VKLPNAHLVRVERRKIVEYLLSPTHRRGVVKARYFRAFGFAPSAWQALARAHRRHGRTGNVVASNTSEFGVRYEVEGRLETPDGRRPLVVTIWQVDVGEVAPRLLTAYPRSES
jgi:hypothetical protein